MEEVVIRLEVENGDRRARVEIYDLAISQELFDRATIWLASVNQDWTVR